VTGDIHASARVELGTTAKVAGNVHYGLIEMAMGAQINGKLIHHSPGSPSSSASVDAPEIPR
jgi:cytoskeletal protein CcmA (bactofilin family)